jgi:hypothetical protein
MPKTMVLSILHFCCFGNKYIVEKFTYTFYIWPVEIQAYTIGWNFESYNCRKYTVLKGNFMFDLGDNFQEHNWCKMRPAFLVFLGGVGGPECVHD